jgi:hypothetical protein
MFWPGDPIECEIRKGLFQISESLRKFLLINQYYNVTAIQFVFVDRACCHDDYA